MRCYIHQDKEAIAICRACCKGLCPDCSVDVGRGLACRSGNCEQVTRDYIALLDRNIELGKQKVSFGAASIIQPKQGIEPTRIDQLSLKLATQAKWTYRLGTSNAIFCFVIGILFLVWAFSDLQKFSFALLFGLAFIVYGIMLIRRVRSANPPPHPLANKTKTT
jgi:hypothetical protein